MSFKPNLQDIGDAADNCDLNPNVQMLFHTQPKNVEAAAKKQIG